MGGLSRALGTYHVGGVGHHQAWNLEFWPNLGPKQPTMWWGVPNHMSQQKLGVVTHSLTLPSMVQTSKWFVRIMIDSFDCDLYVLLYINLWYNIALFDCTKNIEHASWLTLISKGGTFTFCNVFVTIWRKKITILNNDTTSFRAPLRGALNPFHHLFE